jgi:hypothetical protein
MAYNFQVPPQAMRVESFREPDKYINYLTTKIVFEFFGQKATNTETVEFEVYDGWFQEFKDLYFPKWLLKRYPVKKKKLTKDVTMSVTALLPEIAGRGGEKYVMQIWEEPDGRNTLY